MFDIPPYSEMNHKTAAPSNHPNFSMPKGCRTYDIIHDVMPMSLHSNLMFVTDAFIFNALAKAWKQTQIKAGILFVGSTVKTLSLKS
jgi:hypothetical protein